MIFQKVYILFALCWLCHGNNDAQNMLDMFIPELIELNSVGKKEIFLSQINDLDQKVRNDKTDCEKNKYGSLDCAELGLSMHKTDLENLAKITIYLRLYGYPSLVDFSEKAANTPWLVLHHNVGVAQNIDKEFAPILVKAFRNDDVSITNIHWYLKRYYLTYFGKKYERTTQNSEEEDIEELIRVLKVE